MTDLALRRLAWSLTGVSILLAGAGAYLQSRSGPNPFIQAESVTISFDLILMSVVLAALGSLVASRQPHNAIGWILCAIALANGVSWASGWYAGYVISTEPGALPFPYFAAWLSTWVWLMLLSLPATFLILLFPDGHLPSRRWRFVARLLAATIAFECLLLMFAPWESFDFPLSNPVGIEVLGEIGMALFNVGLGVLLLGMVACLSSLVFRYRSADGVQLMQLKTVGFGAAVAAIGLVLDFVLPQPWNALVVFAGTGVFVGAFVMAILRYRLYDIDRIISRTVAYGLLTALLSTAFLLLVLGLQALLPLDDGSPLIVAASTLAVVGAFGPLRARIQRAVDRRFDRRAYDARLTLDAFGARLRSEIDMTGLETDLLAVVEATVKPAHCSLWLRSTGTGT